MFESYYQAMYEIIAETTRIPTAIIETHGRQYQFSLARHFCAMRLWLPDGSINPETEVETLEFMLMPQRVERAIKQWDQAAEE